jgi:hypothetical protein
LTLEALLLLLGFLPPVFLENFFFDVFFFMFRLKTDSVKKCLKLYSRYQS